MGVIASSRKDMEQDHNLVIDYHFSLMCPRDSIPLITQKAGPSINNLHHEIQEEIILTLQQVIRNTDEYNVNLYNKTKCTYCCLMSTLFPIAILGAPAVSLLTVFYYQDIIDEYGFVLFIIGCSVFGFLVLCGFCVPCNYASKLNKINIKWRENTIKGIYKQVDEWQSQYPQLNITTIYPLYIRGHKNKIVDVRGNIHITMAPVQQQQVIVQQPIYQQVVVQQPPQQQPPHSELVALNQHHHHHQQQHVHHRTETPVLLQGADGKQIRVSGQRRLDENGNEVILIQQPQAIPSEPAPPAYNPNFNPDIAMQPIVPSAPMEFAPQSQNEGGNTLQ